MKSLLSSRRFVIILFLIAAVALAGCERQLGQEGDATATQAAPVLTQPAAPTVPAAPTATPDPNAPTATTAPAATTDPNAPAAATADPNAQPTTAAGTGQTTHVVGTGETLFSIAQQYSITVDELAAANNLDPNGVLSLGQVLIIPAAGEGTAAQPTATVQPQATTTAGERVHIVQAGENLYRIGLRYGFTVNELAAYNNIPNPDRINVGQQILIPPGGNP